MTKQYIISFVFCSLIRISDFVVDTFARKNQRKKLFPLFFCSLIRIFAVEEMNYGKLSFINK